MPASLAAVQRKMNCSDLKGKTLTGSSLHAGRSTGCCLTKFLLLEEAIAGTKQLTVVVVVVVSEPSGMSCLLNYR